MQYESITNAAEIQKAGLRQGALAADLELLIGESELETRKAMLVSNPPDARMPDAQGNPTGPTLAEFIAQQEAEVDRLSRRSRRKAKRAKDAGQEVVAKEFKDARIAWLTDTRIKSLEQEHLQHSFMLAERQAALALTGADAPTEADRLRLERQVSEHQAAIVTLENLHTGAKAKRTALKA